VLLFWSWVTSAEIIETALSTSGVVGWLKAENCSAAA
jgi:hypothetical protein